MATRPLTIVSLLKNVPLDADYNHTLYFASSSAQTAWFGSLQRKNFNPQTYQRVGTNQIRVNSPMDDLYEYNYLMFNNGNNVVLPDNENRYENKWFYAFISNVEYVNDNCALITYEIDVMQTFMFDYTLCDCFVEREHSETDGIGDHIEPEPVAVGEYVYNDRYEGESGEGRYRKLLDCSDLKTVLLYLPPQPTDPQEYLITPMYDGVLNECYMAVFNNESALYRFKWEELDNNPDAIVALYTCPSSFINNDAIVYDPIYGQGQGKVRSERRGQAPEYRTSNEIVVNVGALRGTEWLDGYPPKNNKMYTYPYNFYCVDDANGGTLNLRYEFFDSLTPQLDIVTNVIAPVSATIKPRNYKNLNLTNSQKRCNTEILEITNFPMSGTNIDAFQAYIAQNRGKLIFNLPMRATNVGSALDFLGTYYQLSINPSVGVGECSVGNANISHEVLGIYGGRVSVTSNQAKILDDYFTMYGYTCNRVKRPNTSSRPHWNYVKTKGCQINSSIPNVFANKIRGIYDNGVTFWKNASEIGDYDLDNSPV